MYPLYNKNKKYYDVDLRGKNMNNQPIREYYLDGIVCLEKFMLHGKLHRVDGPAVIKYYPSGEKEYEEYYKNGKVHRDNGPAYISYYIDGRIDEKWYYTDGCLDKCVKCKYY